MSLDGNGESPLGYLLEIPSYFPQASRTHPKLPSGAMRLRACAPPASRSDLICVGRYHPHEWVGVGEGGGGEGILMQYDTVARCARILMQCDNVARCARILMQYDNVARCARILMQYDTVAQRQGLPSRHAVRGRSGADRDSGEVGGRGLRGVLGSWGCGCHGSQRVTSMVGCASRCGSHSETACTHRSPPSLRRHGPVCPGGTGKS